MKKIKAKRVEFGELYWVVRGPTSLNWKREYGDEADNHNFETGNYFNTREAAEAVRKKVQAVFEGAKVIKMPDKRSLVHKADLCMNKYEDSTEKVRFSEGFWTGICYMTSKIVN